MKVNLACKNILMSAVLAAGIVVSDSASAGLMNQDFNSGFDNWEGDITSYNTGTTDITFPFTGTFGDFTGNFQTITNGVTLTTSEEIDNEDYFEIVLFQLFDVESLTAGNTALSISLDFSPSTLLADPLEYDTWAFLTDDIGNVLVDLTGGGTHDITSLAGQTDVYLEFGVEDYADIGPSSLTVSNISFTQSGSVPPTSVPEPSTLLLLTGALFAVIRKSKLIAK